jgi:hypothetical protein
MYAKYLFIFVTTTLLPSVVLGQHHHHHNHHHHHHHGSHYGYSNWNYVVPHTNQHRGAYYVQGNSYYYTSSPIVYAGAMQPGYAPPPVQQQAQLQYGGFGYCNDLTGRLEAQINLLCLELYYNYQHNPDFDQTYREVYDLLQFSRQMHALDHQGQREAIRQSVTQFDQQYHHIQQDIAPWTRQNNRHLPPGDAVQKASTAEALLHHLCYDVGIQPHQPQQAQPQPFQGGPEQAPPPRPFLGR